MKILIIGNGAIGNVSEAYSVNKHTSQFAKELTNAGNTVGFLQFEVMMQDNTGLQDRAIDEAIAIHTLTSSVGKVGKVWSYIKMFFFMIKTILKYDFIYIFYPGHVPVMAGFVSILLGKKYGLYIRGQHNIETKVGSTLVKHAQFCLTVSDLLKEKLLQNNANCETIAPMIDFSKKDIVRERDYSSDITHCLFVGRVEHRKGIYNLAEAIDILNNSTSSFHFDIVGGGDSFNEMTERFKDVENVCFKGQISNKVELLNIYRHADLFIFPSHDEGFPRVLYEAMMARIPVLTTMVGGIGGFMKDEHNCLAIDVKNTKSIVEKVTMMLEENVLKMRLVNQATEDVIKLFDGTRQKHSKLLISKLELEK